MARRTLAGSRAWPELIEEDSRGLPWRYASHPVLKMLGQRVNDAVNDAVNDSVGTLLACQCRAPKPPLPVDHSSPGVDYVLLEEKVTALTGMADKELQRQELQAKQIVFSVTAAGTPLVPVAALVGSTAQASEEVRKLTQRLTAIYKVDSGQARQVAIQ